MKNIYNYIEKLAIRSREFSELSGRSEVNLIDLLNSLLENNIDKDNITTYIKDTKLKFRFAKQSYIGKIVESEEQERESLVRKINSNNVTESNSISQAVLNAIPNHLKFFPRDFALKETETKFEMNDETKKNRNNLKGIEKKNLEEIISSNNYYDLSKKHNKRKPSTDILSLFNEAVRTENISLMKKFKNDHINEKDMYHVYQIQKEPEPNDMYTLANDSMNNFENKSERDKDKVRERERSRERSQEKEKERDRKTKLQFSLNNEIN